MIVELVSGNVVVTAEQFNPSILGQIWLARTGLVAEGEFEEGCIFTDTIAQIRTREFELLVVPQRVQFSPNVEADRRQQIIRDKLGLLITRLPETPYRGLGFNLIWHVSPEKSSIEDFSRRLFFVPGSAVHRFFDVADGKYGSYLSRDSLGFRLKLTALPVTFLPPNQEPQEVLAFNFNYHFTVPENSQSVDQIVAMLARWNDAVSESSKIIHALQE